MMAPISASMVTPVDSLLRQSPKCPDKCYIWKRRHESRKKLNNWNSSVININFNDESCGRRSQKKYRGKDNMHKSF